jgi:2-keto-4-pentenoate hydratase
MTPENLLQHHDTGALWNSIPSDQAGFDMALAYQCALSTRALRVLRGEKPKGYKIGFTNRSIWARYNVSAPIWGTVYDTTLSFCDATGNLTLDRICQPRIEPEVVFGMKSTPKVTASLDDLFEAIEWVAPGFEIVQSHLPNWKFKAPDTVADGGLHARLMVGKTVPVQQIATNAMQLAQVLAASTVHLFKGNDQVESGSGANVLDNPLLALDYFLKAFRQYRPAIDVLPGDVVTTGTWTDAWPVLPGETWTGQFSPPLSSLTVQFN